MRERQSESLSPTTGNKVCACTTRLFAHRRDPIHPLGVCLCHFPSRGWFCSLVLCYELGHRKDPRQKCGKVGRGDYLYFFFPSLQWCCLLSENCVDTTESGELWCGGGSYLHRLSCQNPSTVQLYPEAKGALFHTGPGALQTDHAFCRRCSDLL